MTVAAPPDARLVGPVPKFEHWGIHVHAGTGPLPYRQLKEDGCKFIIARASSGLSEDVSWVRFNADCRQHGLLFGAYVYLRPDQQLVPQLTTMVSVAKALPLSSPLFVDIEDGKSHRRWTDVDRPGRKLIATEGVLFAECGRSPGTYSYKSFTDRWKLGPAEWDSNTSRSTKSIEDHVGRLLHYGGGPIHTGGGNVTTFPVDKDVYVPGGPSFEDFWRRFANENAPKGVAA